MIFLTAFEGFEAMQNLKMLWLPGFRWGSLQRSPRSPCWNKQYFVRNNYRNAPEKAILNFTQISTIFDCIKELFMLVIHYVGHAFSGLKSIKSFGLPTFRFGPTTLNALAPALFG